VKRIAESLGGGITLENLSGAGQSGVRVTVRLPVVAMNFAGSLGKNSIEV
jgi:hypothetical protein